MDKEKLADAIQGRLEGALKQFDGDGVLPEMVVEEAAEEMAHDFAGYVSRCNVDIQESLVAEDDS